MKVGIYFEHSLKKTSSARAQPQLPFLARMVMSCASDRSWSGVFFNSTATHFQTFITQAKSPDLSRASRALSHPLFQRGFWRQTSLILIIFAALLLTCSCSTFASKAYHSGVKSDHFDGTTFTPSEGPSLLNKARFLLTFKYNWGDTIEEPERARLNQFKPVNQARITFVGHATFLIQLPDLNILTDPIWSNRAGPIPLPLLSRKRRNPPAITFEDLPKIDYVLLSSASYYHMDIPTIKKLQKKFSPTFVTGLGNCYYLNKVKGLGITCSELDWDQKLKLQNGVDFYFLEAKSRTERFPFNNNKTLWGSFLIRTPDMKIYFAGSGGYSQHLRAISAKHAPIDLALLPIGSYSPRWYMKNYRMSPEEAVKAHILLNAKKSIGIAFNSFQIGNEDYYDSKIELEEAKLTYGLKKLEFVAPKFGEIFEF